MLSLPAARLRWSGGMAAWRRRTSMFLSSSCLESSALTAVMRPSRVSMRQRVVRRMSRSPEESEAVEMESVELRSACRRSVIRRSSPIIQLRRSTVRRASISPDLRLYEPSVTRSSEPSMVLSANPKRLRSRWLTEPERFQSQAVFDMVAIRCASRSAEGTGEKIRALRRQESRSA